MFMCKGQVLFRWDMVVENLTVIPKICVIKTPGPDLCVCVRIAYVY